MNEIGPFRVQVDDILIFAARQSEVEACVRGSCSERTGETDVDILAPAAAAALATTRIGSFPASSCADQVLPGPGTAVCPTRIPFGCEKRSSTKMVAFAGMLNVSIKEQSINNQTVVGINIQSPLARSKDSDRDPAKVFRLLT